MATYKSLSEALRVIVQKRIPQRLSIAVHASLSDMQVKANKTVSDWSDKPRFERELTIKPDLISGRLVVKGSEAAALHFMWTDQGTKAHIIRPKKAPMLKFQTGYAARTAPVAKSQVGDGKATGAHVQTLVVLHPGTDARQFTQTWVKQQTPVLLRELVIAIESAVRR